MASALSLLEHLVEQNGLPPRHSITLWPTVWPKGEPARFEDIPALRQNNRIVSELLNNCQEDESLVVHCR
jgi:hypothetical protein